MILSFLLVASTTLHVSPLIAAGGRISSRRSALTSFCFADFKGSQAAPKSALRMSGNDLALSLVSPVEHLSGAKADVWLRALGVDFQVVEQSKATSKCRDSALERGVSLRQIVKSIVFVEQSEIESNTASLRPRVLQAMLPGVVLLLLQLSQAAANVILITRWQETSRSATPK
jgi:hypothetical protein